MNKDDNFEYKIDENFDHVIDEKDGGNTFLALRKISWGGKDPKLDFRKWFIDKNGNEVMGKGVSFINEERGTNELINVLLQNDYGKTKDVLDSIKDRGDFQHSLDIALGRVKDEEEEDSTVYYDPREELV